MKLSQNLRVVLIAVTVAHVCACGEVSVDGLRNGEKRLNGDPTQVPGDSTDPKGVRLFRGEIQGDVAIQARERVIFVAERDENGVDKVPVFHGKVSVGFGASLVGAAHFLGGLAVTGERDAPVLWRLDEAKPVSAKNAQLEWATVWGGSLELNGDAGWVSAIRHCRIEGVALTVPAVPSAKVEIVWSNLVNVELTVDLPTQNVPEEPAPIPEYLRLASNQFKLSTLRIAQPIPNRRLFWIEANNFEDLASDAHYFQFFRDRRLEDRLIGLGQANYFVHKDRLAPDADWSLSNELDAQWVRESFTAGQDGDIFRGRSENWGTRGILLQGVSVGPPGHFSKSSSEWGFTTYSLEWWAWNYLDREIRNYAVKEAVENKAPMVAVEVQGSEGCSESPDPWGGKNYVCPDSLTMKVVLRYIPATGEPVELQESVSFSEFTAAHAQRRLRAVLTETLGRFVDQGTLAQIPTYTPYF